MAVDSRRGWWERECEVDGLRTLKWSEVARMVALVRGVVYIDLRLAREQGKLYLHCENEKGGERVIASKGRGIGCFGSDGSCG